MFYEGGVIIDLDSSLRDPFRQQGRILRRNYRITPVLCPTDPVNLADFDQEDFVMVHRQGQEALLSLLKERKLLPRDLAVVWALLPHLNWRSGRVKVTATYLANELAMRLPDVSNSLKRLRTNMVISRVYDELSGETYFLFNPWYISTGGSKRRGHAISQFKESLE